MVGILQGCDIGRQLFQVMDIRFWPGNACHTQDGGLSGRYGDRKSCFHAAGRTVLHRREKKSLIGFNPQVLRPQSLFDGGQVVRAFGNNDVIRPPQGSGSFAQTSRGKQAVFVAGMVIINQYDVFVGFYIAVLKCIVQYNDFGRQGQGKQFFDSSDPAGITGDIYLRKFSFDLQRFVTGFFGSGLGGCQNEAFGAAFVSAAQAGYPEVFRQF